MLEQAIEGGRSGESIEPPPGATRELVRQIVRRLDRNEYKRRQSPLVLRTSPKAFGAGGGSRSCTATKRTEVLATAGRSDRVRAPAAA